MIRSTRPHRLALLVLAIAAMLCACTSSRFGGIDASHPHAVESVNPVTNSQVQSQTLPPIGAADGSITTATSDNTFPGDGDPALDPSVASTDGSFVSLDDVSGNAMITTPGGRDLSSPLTVNKLLGAWDVIAGADRCRLNLTQTAKTGTEHYRASTPGCAIAPLARVSSWRLAGTQIQLYDDNGVIIGSLLLSGNRFLGTLVGGIAVSMAG